ncbi:resolvase [Clostridia bacterium]|nr:resolvase [Clostridia bacterium]
MARKSRKNSEISAQQESKRSADRVGAYVRLSSIDRKQKGDSIENQQAIIAAYIDEHHDLELVETYIDNGLSGQNFERPSFKRMLADLESGKINCCISKDFSRLGREAINTGYYIEVYFPAHNIRYIAVNDNYDSSDPNSGGIMIGLKNLVNEAYALDIGRKIHTTKQMNIRNGGFVGNKPPYGYLKSKSDCHKLVPDEKTAPVVCRIFEMAADGDGITAINKWLNDSGILPPKRYFCSIGLASAKESSGHIHWNKAVVYSILKNRIYCGDMVQGKFATHQHVTKNLPESEWIITENTHAPIVSRELFVKVQKQCSKTKTANNKTHEELRSVNPLLRKVFCGHCGHAMGRTKVNGAFYSFICYTNRNYSKGDCVPNRVRETELKETLLRLLREQTEHFATLSPVTTPSQTDNNELRSIQAEIDRNNRFLKGLYESLMCGDITENDYRDMKSAYEVKISELSEQERSLREKSRLQIQDSIKRKKASDGINSVTGIADLTADVADALIEKITVFDDRHIEVKFKFADETAGAEVKRHG